LSSYQKRSRDGIYKRKTKGECVSFIKVKKGGILIWQKGKDYLSGSIGEENTPILVFENKYKKADNHPDFIIYKIIKEGSNSEVKEEPKSIKKPFTKQGFSFKRKTL